MSADRRETIWQGLVSGIFGYATVAILVGMMDAMQGRSFFYTASMLGEHVFYGLNDPNQVVVWPGAVFAYNGLHLLAFLAIGMAAAWLAYMSERGQELWYVAAVLFVLLFLHAFGAILILTEELRSAISIWTIIVPTVFAGLVMTAYLVWARPVLRHELQTWHG